MHSTPSVVVFDVNETLSDMAGMLRRFADVGAPEHLARTWFSGLLRDGFALAASGGSAEFAVIGRELLDVLLAGLPLSRSHDDAVDHIISGLAELDLYTDVADGVRSLKDSGYRIVTLSNGSANVARSLLTRAGIGGYFEDMLSVEDASAWKPARAAYEYAADACGVSPDAMVLVAVHPWDIHGAAHAGMCTAWLNRRGEPYPSYFAEPNYTVGSVGELVVALNHPSGIRATNASL